MSRPGALQRGRLRRAVAWTGAGVGILVTFLVSIVLGAPFAFGTPPGQRIIVHIVNSVIQARFAGAIEIGAIDRLDLDRIALRGAVARDPRGIEVARLDQVEASLDLLEIAREALFGEGDLEIPIRALWIERAEVGLDRGPDGALGLAETFRPRASAAPRRSTGEPRRIRVDLARVHVAEAWVHGEIAPPRSIDGRVRDLRGSVAIDPPLVAITVEPTRVIEQKFLPAPAAGELGGQILLTRGDLIAEAGFQGEIAGAAIAARASIHGDRIEATASAPDLDPAAIAAIAGASPIARPISLEVRAAGRIPTLSVEAEIAEIGAPRRAIRGEGEVAFGSPIRARITAVARAIDPRLFARDAPAGAISGRARAAITLGEGPPRVIADVTTAPSLLAGQRTPPIAAHLDLDRRVLRAAFTAREPGLPIEGRVVLDEVRRVRFDLWARAPAIRDAPRLRKIIGGAIDGAARVRVRGSLAQGRLEARVEGDLEGGTYRDLHGISGRFASTLRGDLLTAEGAIALPPGRGADAACTGSIRIDRAAAHLGGSPFAAATWLGLHGAADISADAIDIACARRIAGARLPEAIGTIGGRVSGRLAVSRGDGDRLPSIHDLAVRTRDLTIAGAAPNAWSMNAIELGITGDFSGKTGVGEGKIEVIDTRTPVMPRLVATAQVTGRAAMTAGSSWSGDVRARVIDLPLDLLPITTDPPISGSIRGIIDVDRHGGAPAIGADLSAIGLRIGSDLSFAQAAISIHGSPSGGGAGKAKLALDLLGHDRSLLAASVELGLRYEGDAMPTVDKTRPASAIVEARAFRLAAVEPLIGGVVSGLDGRLDGRIALSWARLGDVKDAGVKGTLHVTGGSISLPAIGEDLRDAELTVRADPSGVIRLDHIAARGTRGGFHGSAEARFSGVDLVSAHASLEIPEGQELPLALGGVPIGDVRGRIVAEARPSDGRIDVAVKAPSVHLTLPPSLSRRLQPLRPNPDITIWPPIEPPIEPPRLRADGARLVHIGIDLGELEIRGRGAEILLTDNRVAPLWIALARELRMGGNLEVVRGTVIALGKTFEIEPGSLIHFRPDDVSNPYVNLVATYVAPDGTRVTAAYVGTLQPISADKLQLRSDPPRPKEELISLILLGPDAEQGGAAASGDRARIAATMLGGSLVSAELNRIFGGTGTLEGLNVRLLPSETGIATTVGYRFSAKLTATATFGAPPPPGSTQAPEATVSLDWRFLPHWSIRASVGMGDAPSTSLDLLWTRRY